MQCLNFSKRHIKKASDLCTFIEQDILTYVIDKHNFDIVILASLGGIFGSNKNTIEKLRTQVRPGGYIIIDVYLRTCCSTQLNSNESRYSTLLRLINKIKQIAWNDTRESNVIHQKMSNY